MQPKEDTELKQERGFFTKSLGIGILVLCAFIVGNMMAVTGRFDLANPGGGNSAVAGLPDDLNYQSVEEVYDKLRSNYDGKLTEQQVLTGLKKGLAESTGDPYTEYFTAAEAKEFAGQINGTFTGIGAELGEDDDGNIIIVSPIDDMPAARAGLKPQDIIAAINGETTNGMSIDDAVKKIRGEKGTKVTLQIIRGRAQSLSFTITRDNIQIKSVKTEVLDGNIGYIDLNTFGEDTSALIANAADSMKTAGVRGIILDLRGNPGGILDASVSVSSQWLPEGTKVLEEKRGAVVLKTYESDGPATLQGIPTVVLIDQGSASASEIVAGALRDNNAARLIGQKSYGKGVVQQPICITGGRYATGCDGDMLKVTVASWYRPNGQNINKKGIEPDQKVEITDEDAAADRDSQREAAVQYLNSRR